MKQEGTTKTFFAYTPQDFKIVVTIDSRKQNPTEKIIPYGDRATIAVKIMNGNILYGIAVCDEEDKFDKSKGRFIAQERMLQGFGAVPVNSFKDHSNLERLALFFLNNLTESVYNNFGKYAQKVGEFRKKKKKSNKTMATVQNEE